MGKDNNFGPLNSRADQGVYMVASTKNTIKPEAVKSQLTKVSTEEIRTIRCSAYKYLV